MLSYATAVPRTQALPGLLDTKCGQIKLDTIIDDGRENFPERCEHRILAWIAKAQKIKIARSSVRIPKPTREQHCPLEHKSLGIGRRAESVEESFERVAGQYQIEALARFPGEVLQTCTYGGSDVFDRFSDWLSAPQDTA